MAYANANAKCHPQASEMLDHCGINAWQSNSQVVHIVSDDVLGPYERKQVVWPTFAHEPNAVRDSNGNWVRDLPFPSTTVHCFVCCV